MEVALVVVFAVLGELEIWLADVSGPRAVAATAAVLSPIPLVWRRRAPLAVVVACTVIVTAQFLLGVDTTGPSVWMFVLVVAVYTLGERETSRRAIAGGAFSLACLWTVVLTRPAIDPTDFTFATCSSPRRWCSAVCSGRRAVRQSPPPSGCALSANWPCVRQ